MSPHPWIRAGMERLRRLGRADSSEEVIALVIDIFSPTTGLPEITFGLVSPIPDLEPLSWHFINQPVLSLMAVYHREEFELILLAGLYGIILMVVGE